MKKFTLILLVLLLTAAFASVPAFALSKSGGLGWVTDECGLLSEKELAKLDKMGDDIAEDYNVGVYIIIVEDHTDYSDDEVYDVSTRMFHDHKLGLGDDRDGVLMLLSMDERDYALFVHGDWAEYAIDPYGLEKMESSFLDPFGDDLWYEGCAQFYDSCEEYFELAEAGTPVRRNPATAAIIGVGISAVVSFIICSVIRSRHKSVFAGREAANYISGAGLQLSHRSDMFTHITRTEQRIESDSSSSSSHSGGGGHGRSGKF